MFSVSPAEILTIAVIALLVFGPRRLPEIARRTGKVLREIRSAAGELRSGLESEYREVIEPISDTATGVREALSGSDEAPGPGNRQAPPQESRNPNDPATDTTVMGDDAQEGGSEQGPGA